MFHKRYNCNNNLELFPGVLLVPVSIKKNSSKKYL